MSYIRKRGRAWHAEICKTGPDGVLVREGRTHSTRREAMAWADQREAEIEGGASVLARRMTFGELLDRYAAEVSPTKAGCRWEQIRIAALSDDPIAAVRLAELDERHFSAWRDRRLRTVTPATVRREWSLLSGACTVAINEWRLLDRHPMRAVRRPSSSRPRDRLATDDELERILYCLGYERELAPLTMIARVGAALLFAIETAMRRGEIAALCWQDVEFDRRYLRVGAGKTDAARREVPLSSEALRIVRQLETVRDGDKVFRVSATSIDVLFRKARDKAGVMGLTFHDSRHLAITRLAKVLDVLPLAKAIGHRDLRQLMIYYNPSAEDLAKKLP
jgi:integrase